MAPAILTCPEAAMGATGNVTEPGMSEAISGSQQRQEILSMPEKPSNRQESCTLWRGAQWQGATAIRPSPGTGLS